MICSLSNLSHCKEKIEKTSSFITHSHRQRWGVGVDVWESRLVGKLMNGWFVIERKNFVDQITKTNGFLFLTGMWGDTPYIYSQ